MEDCLFCKIVKGEVPSTKIYEDEHVYAFLDINPMNLGHTLVIPKGHCADIHDIPESELHHVISAAKKIANAVKKATDADGVNVYMNNGKAAGQIIFHSHTHVIPRFEGDGHIVWESKAKYEDDGAQKLAERIQEELD